MQQVYDQFRQQVQSQLGEESFSALWDQGRTMPQEHVLAIKELAWIGSPGMEASHLFSEH